MYIVQTHTHTANQPASQPARRRDREYGKRTRKGVGKKILNLLLTAPDPDTGCDTQAMMLSKGTSPKSGQV